MIQCLTYAKSGNFSMLWGEYNRHISGSWCVIIIGGSLKDLVGSSTNYWLEQSVLNGLKIASHDVEQTNPGISVSD